MKKASMMFILSAFALTITTLEAAWINNSSNVTPYNDQQYQNQYVPSQQYIPNQQQYQYNTAQQQYIPNQYMQNQQQFYGQDQYGNIQGAAQNILFIQAAREAVIERDMGESKGNYTLTLRGVQPNLAFFGDQPQRLAGKVSLDQFINDWKSGNGQLHSGGIAGAVHGALVTTSQTPSNVADVSESMIILSEPIYDAKAQELKFKVRNVANGQIQAGRHANPLLIIDNNNQ